jgi:Fur family ferric uptake transcriptional regulator
MSVPTSNLSPARRRLLEVGARATPARERVLDLLLLTTRALSHQEIEAEAHAQGLDFDRVTLYRVLDWLVTQNLAHKIEGRDRVWRFNAVTITETEHGHAHFHCSQCGKVFCLEQLQPSFALTLPAGFHFEKAELTIRGICPSCATD